jgi:hypothetical protein
LITDFVNRWSRVQVPPSAIFISESGLSDREVSKVLSLELLNTIATLTTCVIIATTAISALVQLRHLRASNQITGQLAINALIQSEEFVRAQMIIQGLPAMINDPNLAWAFRRTISHALPPEVVEMRLAARVVGSNIENIGNMVRHRLTDGQLFVEQFANVVSNAWDMLEPYARVRRKFELSNDAAWEDFELLAILSRDWLRDHPTAFPHTRRLLPPWQELVVPDVMTPDDGSRTETPQRP